MVVAGALEIAVENSGGTGVFNRETNILTPVKI
jgi:hypothetical protein